MLHADTITKLTDKKIAIDRIRTGEGGVTLDALASVFDGDVSRTVNTVLELTAAGRAKIVDNNVMATPAPVKTYLIPDYREQAFADTIEKLSRRAIKLGLASPRPETVGEELRPVVIDGRVQRRFDDSIVYSRWIYIEVTEPVVRLPGGWIFLGVVEHTQAGNIIRLATEIELAPGELIRFRDTDPECDHCQLDRRRADTYLVRSMSTGEIKQVGRSCMTDFLGEDFLAALTYQIDATMQLDEMFGDGLSDGGARGAGGGGEPLWDIEKAVIAAAAAVRTVGWTSRSSVKDDMFYAGPKPTADILLDFMIGFKPEKLAAAYPEIAAAIRGKSELDRDVGLAALAWARGIPADVESDYMSNLRVACAADVVTTRTLGIVASVIAAHGRFIEREIAKQRLADAANGSKWIGKIGDQIKAGKLTAAAKKKGAGRIEPMRATITGLHAIDGAYGVTTIIKMLTVGGDCLSWFASGAVDYQRGQEVTVEGTVKKHVEYKGVKETQLTRCTLSPVDDASIHEAA